MNFLLLLYRGTAALTAPPTPCLDEGVQGIRGAAGRGEGGHLTGASGAVRALHCFDGLVARGARRAGDILTHPYPQRCRPSSLVNATMLHNAHEMPSIVSALCLIQFCLNYLLRHPASLSTRIHSLGPVRCALPSGLCIAAAAPSRLVHPSRPSAIPQVDVQAALASNLSIFSCLLCPGSGPALPASLPVPRV